LNENWLDGKDIGCEVLVCAVSIVLSRAPK